MSSRVTTLFTLLIVLGVLALLLDFLFTPANYNTEEKLLRECFKTIRKNDWESFTRIVVTPSDIMSKSMGVKRNPLTDSMTYAGGVLRPEEIAQLRVSFDRAVKGGDGQIDFPNSRFVGLGKKLIDGTALDGSEGGGSIPMPSYSIRVKSNGEEFDTADAELFPIFTLVSWNNEWRMFALEFGDSGAESVTVGKP